MKKKIKKLTLSRETLHSLDGSLRSALGGTASAVCTRLHQCSLTCTGCGGGGASDGGCFQTADLCSNACATGGACSVTCSADTSCC
jgi:hypothetical protein